MPVDPKAGSDAAARERASWPSLGPVAATLYTPLYARAHAAELAPAAGLHDPAATLLLAEAEADGQALPGILRDRGNGGGSVWRTVIFDNLTRSFCQVHPEALVVTAGIGLCTRRQRLADPAGVPEPGRETTEADGPTERPQRVPGTVAWAGVDVPAVVALRHRLLPDDPTTLVPASLADPGWPQSIKADGRPVLILAEGVLMYLAPDELASFLAAAATWFGAGTELVADYFHPRLALSGRHPIVRATGARFRSGARDGRALAAYSPDWALLGEHDVMGRISPLHRTAAAVFRVAARGARMYSIAHLVSQAAGR